VTNLHGLPGIFGGLVAILVIDGIDAGAQTLGVVVTIVVAALSGLFSGKIISLLGRPSAIYDDENEFEDAED